MVSFSLSVCFDIELYFWRNSGKPFDLVVITNIPLNAINKSQNIEKNMNSRT